MERIDHLIAAAGELRFPVGTARAAVAQHGDRWLADMPLPVQHGVEALAEVDQAATRSSAWRRTLMRRDVGYLHALPANVGRGL